MELFYHTYGEGQSLIILHGLYGLSDNWATIARRIAKDYKVYVPDQRNHGYSPHDSTFNYYALVDDLLEFMEQHDIKNPVLMGHSMGGKVAMNFALEYPENVDRLVVIDMGIRKSNIHSIHQTIIQAMESVDFDKLLSRQEIDNHLSNYISAKPLRMFIMKNLKRYSSNRLGWKINLPVIKENMENIGEGIQSNNHFEKPALFVKGGKSDYLTEAEYGDIKKIFPQAVISEIPEATHWLHVDSPEKFCNIVSNFLNNTCKSMQEVLNEKKHNQGKS